MCVRARDKCHISIRYYDSCTYELGPDGSGGMNKSSDLWCATVNNVDGNDFGMIDPDAKGLCTDYGAPEDFGCNDHYQQVDTVRK